MTTRLKRYVGFRLYPSLHTALSRYTAETGRSISEVMGDALDEYLAAHPNRCVQCGHTSNEHSDGLMGARYGDDWLCHTDDHTCYVDWPTTGDMSSSYLDNLVRMNPTKRTRGAVQRMLAEDAGTIRLEDDAAAGLVHDLRNIQAAAHAAGSAHIRHGDAHA